MDQKSNLTGSEKRPPSAIARLAPIGLVIGAGLGVLFESIAGIFIPIAVALIIGAVIDLSRRRNA